MSMDDYWTRKPNLVIKNEKQYQLILEHKHKSNLEKLKRLDELLENIIIPKKGKLLTVGKIREVLVDMHGFPDPTWVNICRNLGFTDEEIYGEEEETED
jgi:hypothetical protein